MGFQIMGTAHLGVPDVGTARCVCATSPKGQDGCPLHQVPIRVMTEPRWPAEAPIELLLAADAEIETWAVAYDSLFTALLGIPAGVGLGDIFRDLWREIRPRPTCDCLLDPHHRWNCALTPIWTQLMRDLDTNPWTVMDPMAALPPPLKLTGTTERFIEFTRGTNGERKG